MYLQTKVPVGEGWNDNWSANRWRNYFQSESIRYNMGSLLGNIIDVEADSDKANKLLDSLLGNVPHPMYASTRSVHHLFLTPDTALTIEKFEEIEFRGYGHCSVLPPSIHQSGSKYQFLKKSELILNPLPEDLLDFYWKNKKNKKQETTIANLPTIKPGHKKTICNICGHKVFIHKKRLILEVRAFAQYGLPWSCQLCRTIDIRNDCREVRKGLRKARYCS